jgi:multidrug resistance efflux pump
MQVDVAQAELTNAQSQLRRSDELFKTQSISEQEYDAARLAGANARAITRGSLPSATEWFRGVPTHLV